MAVTEPTRQQERGEASTNALLAAAGELVLEGGFAAMTFAAIGERAGFSRAMVTSRFGSRQGLIEELLDRIVIPWKEETYPAGHGNTGMQSVVALIESAQRRTAEENPQLRILLALAFEAIGGEPALQERMRDFHRDLRVDLVRVVSRGRTDGTIDPSLDPELEVALLTSSLRGVGYQWLLDPEHFDAVGALAHLRSVTVERLTPSESTP